MAKLGVFYQRYVDDYVICTQKRWQLKRAIKTHYQVLRSLKLQIRYEKTQVGRVTKGLTWLGYQLTPQRITVSKKTQDPCLKKIPRLYEKRHAQQACLAAIRRWFSWAKAGLKDVDLTEMGIAIVTLLFRCGLLRFGGVWSGLLGRL